MTKFELVAAIEAKLGISTSGLWKAKKSTLEAILKGLKVMDPSPGM